MEVQDFLSSKAVAFFSKDIRLTKNDVLLKVAETAQAVYGLDPDFAYASLVEREKASSTGMGQGIALPHARSDKFESIMGIFMRLEHPTEFQSLDRLPVDLVFGIFAPDTHSIDYLKSLSGVARRLRNPETQRLLRRNTDISVLHTILCQSK